MIIIKKKKIEVFLVSLLISLFAFSFNIASNTDNSKENVIATTGVPASCKTVVIDAGHRETR